MLTRTLTTIAAICLGLALVACSDDGEEKPLDAGKQDTSQVLDTGKTDDVYDPDTTPPDQAIVADKAIPDADPGQPSKWTESKSGLSETLYDVWPIDTKNVMAVGKTGTIMKYDGSTWSTMTNPDAGKGALRSLYAGGSNLFAVGDGVDLFYDGTKWNKGYSSSSSYTYLAVWGATTGTYMFSLDSGSSYPYIRYRLKTGTTSYWSSIYFSSGQKTFQGIWGTSDSDVFVVGDGGDIKHCSTSCTTSTSSNWKTMTSGTTSNLRGIWGSSNKDIFAVGYDGVILHYDGTKWTKMTTGTSSYFYAVWGSGPKDVYAVGHPIFKSDESIFHYDGTSWTKMPTPHTTFLEGVRGTSASDVWAVGKTHILHYDGK
jgi:hypothetical protein